MFFFVAKPSADRASIQNDVNIYSKKNSQCRATVLWFEFNAKAEIVGGRPYNHGIIGHQEWALGLLGMFKGIYGDVGRDLSGNKGPVGKNSANKSNEGGSNADPFLPFSRKCLLGRCVRSNLLSYQVGFFTFIGILFALFGALFFVWILDNPNWKRIIFGGLMTLAGLFLGGTSYTVASGLIPTWLAWLLPFL